MIANGFLVICALAVVGGIRMFGRILFNDPCEGSGNYNDPVQYYYNDDDEDEDDEESQNMR
jgi:hypothetical protein